MLKQLEGDKSIWGLIILITGFSFLPAYSASSNLGVNTTAFLIKHVVLLAFGFGVMFLIHKMNIKYLKNLPLILLPLTWILLLVTLATGMTIGDANASRWITVPIVGISFQTSELAKIVLLLFVSRYVWVKKGDYGSFKTGLKSLFLPVGAILVLILPANFSTTAIIFTLCLIILFVGGFPIKQLLSVVGIGIASLGLFILVVLAFPNISNRVDTWKARIENFWEGNSEDNYQVTKAKIAIASGGIYGKGPGGSAQKNFLPQSSSDFIYAVIVEEYGLIGGIGLIVVFLILYLRILRVAFRAKDIFGMLVSISLGTAIIFQAFINIGVAVNIFPVTGQTLPLLSAGGSSILMTSVVLGIILAISRDNTLPNEVPEEFEEEEMLYA